MDRLKTSLTVHTVYGQSAVPSPWSSLYPMVLPHFLIQKTIKNWDLFEDSKAQGGCIMKERDFGSKKIKNYKQHLPRESPFGSNYAPGRITWKNGASSNASQARQNKLQHPSGLEDCTWRPGIYYTTTFSLGKMFNREKMFYHPLMSMYALRHLATGQLPQVLPHDIVISW